MQMWNIIIGMMFVMKGEKKINFKGWKHPVGKICIGMTWQSLLSCSSMQRFESER